jgi:excisionase family DNA binding protein
MQMTDGGEDEAAAPESVLTVAELASVLKMSQSWVRKGVLQRTLPYTKLGRSVRFTPAQVVTILARGATEPEPDQGSSPSHRGRARTRL